MIPGQGRVRFYARDGIAGLTRGDAWINVDLEDPEFPVAVTHLHGPEALALVRGSLRDLDCQTRACTTCEWLKQCSPHRPQRPILQLVR